MPQHRPMQWQLGGRLGPGAPVPESWSVSPLIVCAERPSCRGVGITAGGPPAPICVRPEFAIGIGRMRLPRRRHRTKPPRTARGTQHRSSYQGPPVAVGVAGICPQDTSAGIPPRRAGPCRFSICQNSRKCTFPLNWVKLFRKTSIAQGPTSTPQGDRLAQWPIPTPRGLSPARRRLEGRLLKIARVCA